MKSSKKWLISVIVHYIIIIASIYLLNCKIINNLVAGLICIGTTILLVLFALKNNKLFTPITASLIFDISFFLYLMKLVNTYQDMPFEAMLIINTCMFVWKIITITSKGFNFRRKNEQVKLKGNFSEYSFRIWINFSFIVATSAMLFEWVMAGGVPILRSDQETFRFLVSYSPLTHILAIMNKIIVALIGIYFIYKGKIEIKHDFILLLEMGISELLLIGTAMRGEMIFAPCIIFIFYGIKHKLPIRFYIIGTSAAFIIIGLMPYYRMVTSYGNLYISDLASISTYPAFYMFTPLYQSFSNNFEILTLDFSIFPQIKEFGYGAYSILPSIPFVTLGNSLMQVQNEVLNNGFYAGLTATYMATWYADWGYYGCFLITIAGGIFVNFIYSQFEKKRTLFLSILYSYVFYGTLWMFYNSIFDIVFLCYSLMIWFILKLNIKN